MKERHFSYKAGNSDKFWSVRVRGKIVTTTWGRSGTMGRSKTTTFSSLAEAERSAESQASAKLREGYKEDATKAVKDPQSNKGIDAGKKNGEAAHRPLRTRGGVVSLFETMIRELKTNPKVRVSMARIGPPVSEDSLTQARANFGGQLPPGVEEFYREADGMEIGWEIADKSLRLKYSSKADRGHIKLVPLVHGPESLTADWEGVVWFAENDRELRRVRPVDFDRESAASFYPVPGAAELYFHDIVNPALYPLALTFSEYINLLLESRGLFGWQDALCLDLQNSSAPRFLKIAPQLFDKFEPSLFKPRTRRRMKRFH